MPRLDADRLTSHLAKFKHLEFVKVPHVTAEEAARWSEALTDKYAVLQCPSHGR